MFIQTWTDVIIASLQNLSEGFISFIPALIGAIIVFVVGWIVATAFGSVIERILKKVIRIDKIFNQLGVMKAVHKSGLDWEFSSFVGWIVKWFLLLAFFLAGVDILGLHAVADFLNDVLVYIPNIFVAASIILIAALLADFLEKVLRSSTKAAELKLPNIAAVVVRWSVWIFAFLAAFEQLGIATNLINILFMGLVAFIAIGGGLAFGLGGKDVAKEMLEKFHNEIKEKHEE
jgi:hypothetical protein